MACLALLYHKTFMPTHYLFSRSIFQVFHNYIRFNIQLEAKDKELPSKFMYLGGNDREKARTDFLCQEQ